MGIATFPAGSSGISTAQPVWNLLGYNDCTDSSTTRTISAIPQTYSTLKIIVSGLFRSDADWWAFARLNADSSAVYSDGGAAQGESAGPIARQNGFYSLSSGIGFVQQHGDNVKAGNYGYIEFNVYNYSNASLREKLLDIKMGWQSGGYNTGWSYSGSGLYRPASAAAITSISLISSNAAVNINGTNSSRGFFVFGSN